MFGNNQQLPMDPSDDRKLAVQEVFYTLQGEGPFTGRPAVFIRLAGCNLACTFCDTEFDSGINNRLTVQEILEAAVNSPKLTQHALVNNVGVKLKLDDMLVVITGGEPLRQEATSALCLALFAAGAVVQIETAGTCLHDSMLALLDSYPTWLTIVCSPKTPNVHPGIEEHCTHWKYIVREGETGEDGLPIRGTQPNQLGKVLKLFRPPMQPSTQRVYVSPCDDYDLDQNQHNIDHAVQIALWHGYRLSLQMHKMVGLP